MADNFNSTETDLEKLQLELANAESNTSLIAILTTQISLQKIIIACEILDNNLKNTSNNEHAAKIESQTAELENSLQILTPPKPKVPEKLEVAAKNELAFDNIENIGNKQKDINKASAQKKLLALRQEAEAEQQRLDGVKKASAAALNADYRAATTASIAAAFGIAGIFFPPLLAVSAIVAIVSSVNWTLSTDTWRKGDIDGKRSMPPTGRAGVVADATNGAAGIVFGVATGLAAFAAGAAAVIVAPFLMAGSAALWLGSSIYKTAKDPSMANALGTGASVLNSVATGLATALAFTAIAGLTVLTGGLIIGAIALVAGGLWLASAAKNYFDRKKDLAAINAVENSNTMQNELTNEKTHTNDLDLTHANKPRSPRLTEEPSHSKFKSFDSIYGEDHKIPTLAGEDPASSMLTHSFEKSQQHATKASLPGLTTSTPPTAPTPDKTTPKQPKQ